MIDENSEITDEEFDRLVKEKPKVEPLFTSLSTEICPPCSSKSCFTMESPKPVPPNKRVVSLLACWKLSKMVSKFSFLIPIPVSLLNCNHNLFVRFKNADNKWSTSEGIVFKPAQTCPRSF